MIMQTIRAWAKRRHRIPVLMAIGLLAILALLLTFLLFEISPLERSVFSSLIVWSNALVLVVNWTPIFLVMVLLFFLTANLVASVASVSFVLIAMAVVNRIKLDLRGDPLVHWDFAMLHEALGISAAFGAWPIALAALAIAAFLGLSILLCIALRNEKPAWQVRVGGGLATLAALLLCNATLLSSPVLEKRLPVWGSFYNMADVHNSKGNLYSFLYNWNRSRVGAPAGYSAQKAKSDMDAYAAALPAPSAAHPNIVMIMGEAFSDISDEGAFYFADSRDPLTQFKALAQEGLSGHIVAPSRGGGTSDTEFDVLTARPSRFFRNAPYAYRTIVGPTPAIPSQLRSIGYQTYALHPGYGWFYNRKNVYPFLGFDTIVFEDAFAREAYLDTFIREDATFDMLLEAILAQKTQPEKPLFAFCVTIQNHGGYLDRYFAGGTDNFTATVSLTDTEQNILSNYFAGVVDADEQLGRLAAFLREQDEPYVLVYFGDHLPSFEPALYDKIIPGADAPEGSYTQLTRLYRTPFLIWQNEAASALGILPDLPAAAQGQTFSSHYLGAYLLELLGLDAVSPLFRYANALRDRVPVVMESISFGANHQPIGEGSAEAAALQTYRHWTYWLQSGF